jgi:hypothetical protein
VTDESTSELQDEALLAEVGGDGALERIVRLDLELEVLVPLLDDKPMDDAAFGALTPEARTELMQRRDVLMEKLKPLAKQGQGEETEAEKRLAELQHSVATHGVDTLVEWLSDTRLDLHSMHAPICEAFKGGQWVHPYSNAATAEDRRQLAVKETVAALAAAARVPFRYLVMHVGTPDEHSVQVIMINIGNRKCRAFR